MKNKKKNIVLYISIILVISILVVLIFLKKNNTNINTENNKYRTELSYNEKRILVEKSYINYAWKFKYSGMAIFNDGTIYKWDYSGDETSYNVYTFEDQSRWILENGELVNNKVIISDLEDIENSILNLEDSIESTNTANDAGLKRISIWKDNKKISLKEEGDYTGENKTTSSQNIIKIITKYLK